MDTFINIFYQANISRDIETSCKKTEMFCESHLEENVILEYGNEC